MSTNCLEVETFGHGTCPSPPTSEAACTEASEPNSEESWVHHNFVAVLDLLNESDRAWCLGQESIDSKESEVKEEECCWGQGVSTSSDDSRGSTWARKKEIERSRIQWQRNKYNQWRTWKWTREAEGLDVGREAAIEQDPDFGFWYSDFGGSDTGESVECDS